MTRCRGLFALVPVAALAIVACTSTGVRVTKSNSIDDATSTTAATASSTPGTDNSTPGTGGGTTDGGDGLPAIAPVAWGRCNTQPAPWQCGSISVPLDYKNAGGQQISIAMTRLPAADTGHRIGSLVINPGGPGGSGIDLAYGQATEFPKAITDRFDIVGFDPRGVGSSTAVKCPTGFDQQSAGDFTPCVDASSDLLPYLGTPNVARDLEMIRRVVRDDKLTYLGFSYGTALGAVYADMFPTHLRAMVLDGAVDPNAGESNQPGGGGYDFYAQQDFESTTRIFQDLCDATPACPAGPHTRQLMDHLESTISGIPTPYFDGGDVDTVQSSDLDNIVQTAMYTVTAWPVLAIALADAANGDASTLSAMFSWLQFGYPRNMEREANYEFANIAIRCADFIDRAGGRNPCHGFPDSKDSLPVIKSVQASEPVVVVGTDGDPATPGRYAADLATALGDAVSIEWQGAGHTAFLTSACITDLVTSYFVEQKVPANGASCPFVVGATSLKQRGDKIFGLEDPARSRSALIPVLEAQGDDPARAACIADGIVAQGDQHLIVDQVLGVDAPGLVGLRGLVEGRCR